MNLGNKLIITRNLMITKTNLARFVFFTLLNFATPVAFLVVLGNKIELLMLPYVAVGLLTFIYMILAFSLIVYNDGILTQEKAQSQEHTPLARSPVARKVKMSFTNLKIEKYEIAVLHCKECDVYLPLKGFHCDPCGVCYDDYRHHSYFLNNCITKHNLLLYLSYLSVGMSKYAMIFTGVYLFSRTETGLILFVMLMISSSCFGFTYSFYRIICELHNIGLNRAVLIDVYKYDQKIRTFDRQYWNNIKNFFAKKTTTLMLKKRDGNTELANENKL